VFAPAAFRCRPHLLRAACVFRLQSARDTLVTLFRALSNALAVKTKFEPVGAPALLTGFALCHRRFSRVVSRVSAELFGYLHVSKGKSKNAKRDIPLTPRVRKMLALRRMAASSKWVFPNEKDAGPFLVTSLDHQQAKMRVARHLADDFVVHSFRHTMLTRLGLSGADVFTLKNIAGHSSVQVSEKYVHPSSESKERAIEKMMAEYHHIGEHDSVNGDTEEEAAEAQTPPKTHHSGKSAILLNSPKLLQ
jgi:integrase-like protein